MHSYTLPEVAALLGLSPSVISGLVAAGFVSPARGPKREYRFSFPDLVLLRAAQDLQAAQIPPRRILRSLRELRARLPEEMPLAGLRIGAVGNEVVVRSGSEPWRAGSGQLLFDFEAPASASAPTPATGAQVRTLAPRGGKPSGHRGAAAEAGEGAEGGGGGAERNVDADDAEAWFTRAATLERSQPAQAQAAYRRAIALDAKRADAYLNLGVLLGEAGRHAEAAAIYRQGLALCEGEALLHFNLAVTLEDLGQPEAAVAAYERSLALDATLADAHFNLARLHDQLGRAKGAIRHYSAYRRLRGPKGEG